MGTITSMLQACMELMGKGDAQSPLVWKGGREANQREKWGEAEV